MRPFLEIPAVPRAALRSGSYTRYDPDIPAFPPITPAQLSATSAITTRMIRITLIIQSIRVIFMGLLAYQ